MIHIRSPWRSVVIALLRCADVGGMWFPRSQLIATARRGGQRFPTQASTTYSSRTIGTLESNSPVLMNDVVVGSVRKMTFSNWPHQRGRGGPS